MLIRNQYDGRLYEVPETAGYGEYAGPGYQGYGFLPFLAPLAAKVGAKLLPRALPFLKKVPIVGDLFGEVPRLRRFRRFPFGRFPFRRFPFRPGVPFRPGMPLPPPGAPVVGPLLSTRIARKVVAMLRQQGLQVTPAGPPPPPPGPDPSGPPPDAVPPGPEPAPGVSEYAEYAEYPYDQQEAESDGMYPYVEQMYPYATPDPYQSWWRRRRYPWYGTRSGFSPWRPRTGWTGGWGRRWGGGRWTGRGVRSPVIPRHQGSVRRAAAPPPVMRRR